MIKSSNFILGSIARTPCTLVFVHIQERFSKCSIFASLTHIRCRYCIRRLWRKFLRNVFAFCFYQFFPQGNHSLKQNLDSNMLSNRFPNIAHFFWLERKTPFAMAFSQPICYFTKREKYHFIFPLIFTTRLWRLLSMCLFKVVIFLKHNLKILRHHHCKMSFSGPIRKCHLAQWHFRQNQQKRCVGKHVGKRVKIRIVC